MNVLKLGTVVLILGMTGCASVKPCEKFSAIAVPDHGGNIWYAFDQSNVEKLASTLKGLSEGTCRIEK